MVILNSMKRPQAPPKRDWFKDAETKEKITEYFGRDEVREALKEVNERYLPWDKIRRKGLPDGVEAEPFWGLVKTYRAGDMRKLDVLGDKNMVFTLNTTADTLQRELHELDMDCGGTLEARSSIPEKEQRRYLLSSLMEEAIASSQLEGATTTREVAKEMLKTRRRPRDKKERMILNNYVAIKKIVEAKKERLTSDMIRELQAILTKDTLDDERWEGRFRDNDEVRVRDKETGEVVHTPPHRYKDLPRVMERYCEFANADEPYLHPIVKGAVLHFLMGYIHPFEDGNGRAARAIFYWYMLSHGYWLFQFMSISRAIKRAPARYARAYLYSEQDDNDLTYFIRFHTRAIKIALKELKEYIRSKQRERETLYEFKRYSGINERQAYILTQFSDDPKEIMSISEAQELFDVTYQTARIDLLQLEELGFLERKTSRKKILFFRSPDFEHMVERLSKRGQ